ncbi:hypothetical protein EMMF5_003596 [Cystobasidiomycetes sp. EMM_F5]
MAIGASLWHGERITEPFPALRDYPESAGDPAEIAGDAFANQAKSYFNEECEMPMQSTVNGLLLLASFYSGRGKPNLGRQSGSKQLRASAITRQLLSVRQLE